MPPRPAVFLGLGSNLGDREAALSRARELLGRRGFRVTGASGIYETEPVGGPPQGPYLNQDLQPGDVRHRIIHCDYQSARIGYHGGG